MDQASVEVVTIERAHGHTRAWSITDDWAPGIRRDQIFAQALAHLKLSGKLIELEKRETPHARELEVVWEDGKRLLLHLDEGFGFMKSITRPRYDFHAPWEEQGQALLTQDYELGVWRPTRFYAASVG